jgi:hypothetical protein
MYIVIDMHYVNVGTNQNRDANHMTHFNQWHQSNAIRFQVLLSRSHAKFSIQIIDFNSDNHVLIGSNFTVKDSMHNLLFSEKDIYSATEGHIGKIECFYHGHSTLYMV